MAIEAKTLQHQAIEMAQQKIRQIERPRLRLGQRSEHRSCREELVAMCAGNALHALLAQHLVEHAARSAVAIGNENRAATVAGGVNQRANRSRNLFRSIVQFGRQAAHGQRIPAVRAAECSDLVRQRTAGDDQQPLAAASLGGDHSAQCAAAPARRAAISPLAVSTATAASRQYASAPTALPNSSLSGAPPTRTM